MLGALVNAVLRAIAVAFTHLIKLRASALTSESWDKEISSARAIYLTGK